MDEQQPVTEEVETGAEVFGQEPQTASELEAGLTKDERHALKKKYWARRNYARKMGREVPVWEEFVIFQLGGEQTTPEVGEVEEKPTSFRERLAQIKNIAGNVIRSSPRQKTTRLNADEVANLILAPLVIVLANKTLVEEARPTADETTAFVTPIARIIERHIQLPGALSADVYDLMCIMVASITWYTRVSSMPYVLANQKPVQKELPPEKKNGRLPVQPTPTRTGLV